MNELGHAWVIINPPVNLNHIARNKCILRIQVYHLHLNSTFCPLAKLSILCIT